MHLQDRRLRGLEPCMPLSQLEQNVTVYVSPLATLYAQRRQWLLPCPSTSEDGRARRGRATRPRWTAGFDPRGLEESPRGQRRGGAQRERRHPQPVARSGTV